MVKKVVIRTIPRDAKTGQIVKMDYALKHPNTTVIEHRKVFKK